MTRANEVRDKMSELAVERTVLVWNGFLGFALCFTPKGQKTRNTNLWKQINELSQRRLSLLHKCQAPVVLSRITLYIYCYPLDKSIRRTAQHILLKLIRWIVSYPSDSVFCNWALMESHWKVCYEKLILIISILAGIVLWGTRREAFWNSVKIRISAHDTYLLFLPQGGGGSLFLFWGTAESAGKALMFIWKGSIGLENGLVVPGFFLARATNQAIVTKF